MAKANEEKQRRAPILRFKGFTDDWEQRKLKNIFETVSKKGFSELPVLMATQTDGMIYRKNSGINIKFDKSSLSNYKLVEPNQFVVHLRSFQGGLAASDLKGIASPAYTVLRFKDSEQATNFWQEFFKSKKFINSLVKVTYGIRDGRTIKVNDLLALKYTIPDQIKEQYKIGKLISSLNDLIALYERKLELLSQVKRYFLDNLFANKQYPNLRFKGFTDAWEQRQLEDISKNTIGGGTPQSSNNNFWNGNIPWIQSSDLNNGNIWNINIKKHVTSDGVKNSAAKIVSANSIAVVTRVAVGKVVYMPFKYTTSQDFISFQDLNGDYRFLMYLISKVMRQIKGNLQGTSIKGVSKKDLLKKKIFYALNIKEQKKIGILLKSLDTILTLYENKQKQLLKIKNNLLNNMFI